MQSTIVTQKHNEEYNLQLLSCKRELNTSNREMEPEERTNFETPPGTTTPNSEPISFAEDVLEIRGNPRLPSSLQESPLLRDVRFFLEKYRDFF